MIGIGTWYFIKYRNPDVRAKHVEYWTAKAQQSPMTTMKSVVIWIIGSVPSYC